MSRIKLAAMGLSVQVSNAPAVSDLAGGFYVGSVHAGAGVGGSIDTFTGTAANGQPIFGGGFTAGAQAGASGSAGYTYTHLAPVTCRAK